MRFLILSLCYFFWGANAQAQNYVDSLRKVYGTDEYNLSPIFLWEETETYYDSVISKNFCVPLLPPPIPIEEEIYSFLYIKDKYDYANVTDSAENVLVKKNNKWGVWNFKKSFFTLNTEYDSILPVNTIAEPKNSLSSRYYINHFLLVLKNNKWYLLDSAFQKKDTVGYDSVYIEERFSKNLILFQKENLYIYNPFNNKLFFVDSAQYHKKEYGRCYTTYVLYHKNKKMGVINTMDSIYYPPIYKLINEYRNYFLLKDDYSMDFLYSKYRGGIYNLQTKIWNVNYWVDAFCALQKKQSYSYVSCYDYFVMFKTIHNKYLFFSKKKGSDKYTLKTVPFIDILEPIYLLFLSPYYQKIE